MSGSTRRLLPALALLVCAAQAQAHDFWLEPSTFHPLPGTIVSVGLRVGQDFIGDAVPRQSDSIAAFYVRQSDGESEIGGADRIDPAGFFRADGVTTAIVAYASTGADLTLPAAKFEDYLRQYGLERIVAERRKRSESDRPGRERFYRYAKALLGGSRASDAVSKPLGLAYEIVPDDDPTVAVGPLRGRVLYDGQPLAGARVTARLRGAPSAAIVTRSNAHGSFSFALPHAGVWLITSVHMVRASFFAGEDWDSLWASLTFEWRGPGH